MADENKPAVEEVKNCPSCNKPLKRARRFFRNGKYYCNSNCFKKAWAKAQEAKQQAATQAAEAAAAAPKE